MRIKSIELENFGPYYGQQRMDLSTDAGAPVVLVHGENMRGKTTLFHAIRWCLYEHVQAHSGDDLTVGHFANWDMRDDDAPFTVSVTLVIDDDAETLTLKRWATCMHSLQNPDEVRVTDPGVSLLSGTENSYPREDIQDRINGMLNESFADLFLFDGETLANYERNLKTEELAREVVRTSIEKALGLTAFNMLTSDLAEINGRVDKDYKKLLKDRRAAENLLKDLEAETALLESYRDDMTKVKAILQDAAGTKERLRPIIETNITFLKMQQERDQLETEIEELVASNEELRQRIAAALKSFFWLPCNHGIEERLAATRSAYSDENQRSVQKVKAEVRQVDLHDSLELGSCLLCEQALSDSTMQVLRARLADIESKKHAADLHHNTLNELSSIIAELQMLPDAASKIEFVRDWDSQIRAQNLRRDTKLTRRKEITEQLAAVSSDFSNTEREYDTAVAEISQAAQTIPTLEQKITQSEAKKKALEGNVRDFDDDSPLKRKIEVIEDLSTIYGNAVTKFRERMRGEVQTEASRIFRDLTTEAEYGGLRINPSYYLRIVDHSDRAVMRRSAGADQIVALSLIGALVECSVREAPVVIDTPLGRLDEGHRRRVLQWIPNLGNQVVLFVTSGEFDSVRDRPALGQGIGREYELVRISERRTEIRKRNV